MKVNLGKKSKSASYGEKDVDISTLDNDKVEKLMSHKDLVKALDDWILSPDMKLVPKLIQLGKVVDDLYEIDSSPIYRGITVSMMSGSYQNTMDLVETNWLGIPRLKEGIKVGYKFNYTASSPTSFSYDICIAREFGLLVVKSSMPDKGKRLVITNELNYIISKRRNLKSVKSQDEVIAFNGAKLKCEVMEIPR